MATTLWPYSGTLQHTLTTNEIALGAEVSFFDGGTTTPKIVYQDSDENVAFGSTLNVDGFGRWPNVFVPTGTPYAFAIRGADGTIIHFADNVPNPDPAPGSGTPPPAETIATGTPRWFFETGEKSGWVRINGRTIGSATSGATERANDDTENLFTYIWDNIADAQATVPGGRGGSAAVDWASNKQITLPDMRSASILGADDMGNTAAGRFTGVPFDNGNETTIASVGGYNSTNITTAQLPVHNHTVNITTQDSGSHDHVLNLSTQGAGGHNHGGSTGNESQPHNHRAGQNIVTGASETSTTDAGSGINVVSSLAASNITTDNNTTSHAHPINSEANHVHAVSGNTNTSGLHNHSVSGATENVGTGAGLSVAHRFAIVTWYIKL